MPTLLMLDLIPSSDPPVAAVIHSCRDLDSHSDSDSDFDSDWDSNRLTDSLSGEWSEVALDGRRAPVASVDFKIH